MLEVENAVIAYGSIQAIKGVSLRVAAGELVALIGANGAGKTTILRAISGLLRLRQGRIRFDGRPSTHLQPHRLVQRGMAHCPEGRHIFPTLSVAENLRLGAVQRYDRTAIASDYRRVLALFPILAERQNQAGATLSGGEQQMLAIGRALMSRPRLLLLDEPSLGLAPQIVAHIFEIIAQLKAEGTTILLVEQNARKALEVADRVYVLETGRVALEGAAAALRADERVKQAYLGG